MASRKRSQTDRLSLCISDVMRGTKIIVDNRERNFELMEGLEDNEVSISFAQLPVGDYIISDRLCVERKTVRDFESSIMDSRLFEQADRLRQSFEKPLLILEGGQEEFTMPRNAVVGAMLRLYTEYGVQLIFSSGHEETSYMLSKLAEKEQIVEKREPRLLGNKKAYNTYQWQILMLSAMPGIGPKLASSLIRHFKTLRNVATASVEDLMEIEKVGKKKAQRVYEILNAEFSEVEGI